MKEADRAHAALAFLALCLLPAAAFADAPRTFSDVATVLLAVLGQATLALMAAAVAIYFGKIAFNILQLSRGEASQQRTSILWGVITIFIMVSIWGIIQILQNTLFDNAGSGANAPSASDCVNFGDPGCGS